MKQLLISLMCFALVAVIASAGGDTAGKIDGTWLLTAASRGKRKAPDRYFAEMMVTSIFKDGKYSVYTKGKLDEAGTYRLDATKTPAAIDLMIGAGKDKGKLQLGIYKRDGDTLTLAVGEPGSKTRPKSFEPDDAVEIQVMKRKK